MTIAFWCVLIAALLPHLVTGIAKAGAPGFDNRRTRDFQAGLSGWRARAHAAHLNGFEALPLFASAVIIAHLTGKPQAHVDALAACFIVLRLVYGALYIADQATLRSLVWLAATLCPVAMFFL